MLATYWEFLRGDAQAEPEGRTWRVWLFLGGRGAGKTRAGAEWVNHLAASGQAMRIGLIGASLHEVRAVMVEGASGLLRTSHPRDRPVYERTARRLTWPSGAVAEIYSGNRPQSLRGPQFDLIWADEFAKWEDPEAAYDMAQLALRIGEMPRMLVTTTPTRLPFLKALKADAETVTTHATTRANDWRLAPGFVAALENRYGGTALARQEIGGELLQDAEDAMFRRAWIDAGRVGVAPELKRIVVAVDPPVSQGPRADACGIVVAGRARDGEIYVLADRTVQGLSPDGWAKRVMQAAEAYEADAVLVETNQGGDVLRGMLANAGGGRMRVTPLHAKDSKRLRAGPVSQLYEQGRVHHVGALHALEDELCLFGSKDAGSKSPDRVDALVWAVNDLAPVAAVEEPRVRGIG